jgi:hypothetical protein
VFITVLAKPNHLKKSEDRCRRKTRVMEHWSTDKALGKPILHYSSTPLLLFFSTSFYETDSFFIKAVNIRLQK